MHHQQAQISCSFQFSLNYLTPKSLCKEIIHQTLLWVWAVQSKFFITQYTYLDKDETVNNVPLVTKETFIEKLAQQGSAL